MDDVSGVADRSNDFSKFLTVAQSLTLPVSKFFIQFIFQGVIGR